MELQINALSVVFPAYAGVILRDMSDNANKMGFPRIRGTIEDKRGEFFYLVKVRTHKNAISYRKEQLPIIPGMVTTVDILTGKKTVLDYILKPILKARQNALRER